MFMLMLDRARIIVCTTAKSDPTRPFTAVSRQGTFDVVKLIEIIDGLTRLISCSPPDHSKTVTS
jgi:hypothetical protein